MLLQPRDSSNGVTAGDRTSPGFQRRPGCASSRRVMAAELASWRTDKADATPAGPPPMMATSHICWLYYLADFLAFAQRAFWAAAILARPSAESFRVVFLTEIAFLGRPGPGLASPPTRSLRTSWSFAISVSRAARILEIFMAQVYMT